MDTSGQILVFHDIVGLHPKEQKSPKFVKQYLDSYSLMTKAMEQYRLEVLNLSYPSGVPFVASFLTFRRVHLPAPRKEGEIQGRYSFCGEVVRRQGSPGYHVVNI